MNAIEINSLKFTWTKTERPLLHIENFKITNGESVFLKGKSGSGKSTLLSLLSGIQLPNNGEIKIFDCIINQVSSSARDRYRADNMGYIFQQFNLIPYLSIIENVILPCQLSKKRYSATATNYSDLIKEAERLLAAVGLSYLDYSKKTVLELSIGEQQRVAACRALIGKPKVILADEPTSSLDADAQKAFVELIMNECKQNNISLLFVSHDIRLARLFDKQFMLENGKIREYQAKEATL